jgi:hypothetical protein
MWENALISSGEMVLMETAKTEIRNPQRKIGQVSRVLFNSGSQRTYISESLAKQLNLKGEREEFLHNEHMLCYAYNLMMNVQV